MELWTALGQTSFRLALLPFFVLLEVQTLSEHQEGADGGWSVLNCTCRLERVLLEYAVIVTRTQIRPFTGVHQMVE